jgi:hypothetical protein
LLVLALGSGTAQAAGFKDIVNSCTGALLGHAVFGKGKVVHGEFVLAPVIKSNGHIDRTKISFVFDNRNFNWNGADVYEVPVTPDTFFKYMPLFSKRLVGDVRVTADAHRRFAVGNRVDYDGEVIGKVSEVSIFNPVTEVLATMERDTPVVIEGTVVEMRNGALMIDNGTGTLIQAGVLRKSPHLHMIMDPGQDHRLHGPVKVGDEVRVLGIAFNGHMIFSPDHGVTLL